MLPVSESQYPTLGKFIIELHEVLYWYGFKKIEVRNLKKIAILFQAFLIIQH